MNSEFLERYRTAILMLLSVFVTAAVLYLAYKKDDIQYLDRALFFFSGMTVFFVFRNLIKSIKVNNQQLGIQIEASSKSEETETKQE